MKWMLLFLVALHSAMPANVPFDQQISDARQQILSGDYAEAALSITMARSAVASLGAMPRDYGAIKAAGLSNASATTSTVLNALWMH